MLRQVKKTLALMTLLALGACNSITGPAAIEDDNQNDGSARGGSGRGWDQVEVGDEIAPLPGGGGGGGDDVDRETRRDGRGRDNRFPQEVAPAEMQGGGGPGPATGRVDDDEHERSNRQPEGGDVAPVR